MTRTSEISRAVRRALFMSAVATASVGSLSAYAQDQDQDQEQDQADVTTVTVTGTRIASPNLEAISPVTAITSEELGLTGKVRIEDVINQLPQAFAAQGSQISNGSDGTASVDLRGLGSQRTLVLVNGRRLMPGDPDGGSAADLNQIPLALVKRVDVLTGGASSVYGADAVAGVVNFVMDTDFEGFRFEGNYSFNQHKNDHPSAAIVEARGFPLPESSVNTGYAKDFTLALGIGGEEANGHATFYATYRDVDAILQAQYDYSACTFNSGAANFTCGGSGTSEFSHFFVVNPITGNFSNTATCPSGAGCALGVGNVLRPFTAADQYNFGPVNHYQRPDERYTVGAFLDYDMSETAQVYGEMMFMDDRTVAQIAPSGSFLSGYSVNCANPLWTAQQRQEFCGQFGLAGPTQFAQVLVGKRNTEGGGRQDDIGHESYRVIAGFRGELGSSWNFDAYFQHGVTRRLSTYLNDFSIVRTARALDVVTDPDTGGAVCASVLDGTDPNCVPYNIWTRDSVSPEALAYLQTPGLIRAQARQQIAHVDFTGDLSNVIKLPTAETGLVLNAGVEYRDENTEFRPDTAFETGDLAGQGGATTPVGGRFDAQDAFFEARMPLVEGKPGIEALSFETGYRYSEYSTGFDADTYKVGLDYAPIEQVRLRGSFQRAVRAPNVGELFSSQSVALSGTDDPCDGVPDATLAQCQATGMTAAQYGLVPENPASQYNGLLGGNPNLQPESSDTMSFGVVFRPSFANLVVAVDYFDIEVDDTIVPTVGGLADVYITQCVATQDPAFCNLIHRDSLGSLWLSPTGFIEDTALNIGALSTKGIDLQANYTLNLGDHRLGFSLVGTRIEEFMTEPVKGLGSYDCAGLFGSICGVPAPEWRHSFRTNWRTPWRGLDVSATWRYFDAVDLDRTSTNPQLARPTSGSITDLRFGSRSYLDLTGSITFAENYTLRIGANNVTDKDPPLVGQLNCPAGPCNGNAFAQVYDVLGRQWFATLTVDF
jgi:iron complex outermembrane recepter protein